jgi:dGTPase
LAGVTQVVGPLEGHVFHNRLTHTLEVAQLSRRLAQRLVAQQPDLVAESGGLDPDVAEAAALIHDMGHAPFGHVGEQALNDCAINRGNEDGFEGNAQSFRIVTTLAAHRTGYPGLNLTRATLDAVLKYPWFRGKGPRNDKYGAYRTEAQDFQFARSGKPEGSTKKSLAAAVMDLADAIAYSVHDLDDFFRAGLIPLEMVRQDFPKYIKIYREAGKKDPGAIDRNAEALESMVWFLDPKQRYTGSYTQRAELRGATSELIHGFVSAAMLRCGEEGVELFVPEEREIQLGFLQNLVWENVIHGPRLATQQSGHRRIVEVLFGAYLDAIVSRPKRAALVPAPFQEQMSMLVAHGTPTTPHPSEVRLAVDIVASFTDAQAAHLFQRITGMASGLVTDLIDR